jgi:predicted dehydrogenase
MRRRTFVGAMAAASLGASAAPPRLGMAGLVHGHAAGFLSRYRNRADIALVGIAEPDRDVAARYVKQFQLDPATIDPSVEAMLERARPEGVVVFTGTMDHRPVVEACARRKVPVMMEKPLAASNDDARAIERAAKAAGIAVLVNFETTWYPSNRDAWSVIKEAKALGAIRKVVVHDGHRGPKEIGVQPEFLAWLTDPKKGGGALLDFGCYGANLMTWLMDNQRPRSVTAVTQQFKPEVYPRVNDGCCIRKP